MDLSVHQFDLDTQVTKSDTNLWTGNINPAWNIGDNPNGGYLLSCVIAALKQVLPHPDPVTLTTHYLRPGVAGAPFEVFVEVIRTGRTLSSARASLTQEGKRRLEVLCTFGDLAISAGIDSMLTVLPPPIPAPEACIQRTGDAQGVTLPIG
ncbi:MAG: acyl-CoA thioesterase, partial [Candidatus Azotimanducaceae bacterium]